MADPHDTNSFASRLLRQDEPVSDAQYREYRMKLEEALTAAERGQRRAGQVAVVSLVLSVVLVWVGGSGLLGSFDPWSKEATPWSVAAGVAYILVAATCALSIASYYSRFRPATREAKDRIRDAILLDIQRQLRELREQVAPGSRRDGPKAEGPKAD